MKTDLQIWDEAAELWSKNVTASDSVRSVYFKQALDELIAHPNGLEILDAGCGDGVFTKYLTDKGAHVIGTDGSSEMIKYAKEKYPQQNFDVIDLLESLKFPNQKFDLVLANMVLMHLSQIDVFVSEAKRVLKPNGGFIFSVLHPAFNNPTMRLYKSLWAKLTGQKPSGLAFDYFQSSGSRRFEAVVEKELTHYHRTIEEYSKIINKNGFVIDLLLEPHKLTEEYLARMPKMEYTTRLPRFLFFSCRTI